MIIKLIAAATLLASTAAFTIQNRPLSAMNVAFPSSKLYSTEAPCDIPADVLPTDLTSEKGSASILRSAVLTNVDGDFVSLGRLMGKGKSVVIFLRHMG